MHRFKMSCNWKETKNCKNLKGLRKVLWKYFWSFNEFWRFGMWRKGILCFDGSGTERAQTGQTLYFKYFGEREGTNHMTGAYDSWTNRVWERRKNSELRGVYNAPQM